MWDSVPRVTVALLVWVLHLAPGTGLRHISSDTVFNGQLQALGGAADWLKFLGPGSGRPAWGPRSQPAGACAGAHVWGEPAPHHHPGQPRG